MRLRGSGNPCAPHFRCATARTMKFILAASFAALMSGSGLFVLFTGIVARWYAPSPPSRGLQTVAWWIRETVSSVAMLPLLACGVMSARAPTPGAGDDNHVPVLLLHGYDMNRGSMWPLQWYLQKRGWRWAHAVNHGPWGNPIPAHARHLAEHVRALKRSSGAPKVDIVAHSMGGLIAAWFVSRMDGADHIRRIVTIGTPWRGTRMAYLGRRTEARDLEPESTVIADVAHTAVPVVAIWTPTDQIVVPASSSAPVEHQCVCIDLAGHLDLLFDGRTFAAVRDALTAPTILRPEPV